MEGQQHKPEAIGREISVRTLKESDLDDVDHIFRQAFGTHISLSNPTSFGGDSDPVRTRWLADPTAAFGAEFDDILVGSIFATHWGSVGLFGPLSVRPDLWDRGIAKRLIEPVIELFSKWGISHGGLFTWADNAKHIGLYQKFGFWPRFLTVIMVKPVGQPKPLLKWSRYSMVPESDRAACLMACYKLTNFIYEGLDLKREIQAVDTQGLGDTVLLWDDVELVGMAVCHSGQGSEAGSSTCYVKFGVARPGPTAEHVFTRLLDTCEAFAVAKGMSLIVAGVNTERCQAYRKMMECGFRTQTQGVAMHRPNEPGYNRTDIYAIDDWR
ncbi:GNAT family N-acetyltransferase [Chloroflexota bacterium]